MNLRKQFMDRLAKKGLSTVVSVTGEILGEDNHNGRSFLTQIVSGRCPIPKRLYAPFAKFLDVDINSLIEYNKNRKERLKGIDMTERLFSGDELRAMAKIADAAGKPLTISALVNITDF